MSEQSRIYRIALTYKLLMCLWYFEHQPYVVDDGGVLRAVLLSVSLTYCINHCHIRMYVYVLVSGNIYTVIVLMVLSIYVKIDQVHIVRLMLCVACFKLLEVGLIHTVMVWESVIVRLSASNNKGKCEYVDM